MKCKTPLTLAAAALASALALPAIAGSDSVNVVIGGNVGANCNATADAVDVGAQRSKDVMAGVAVPITLRVQCTSGVPYQISLGNAWSYSYLIQPDYPVVLELVGASINGSPLSPVGGAAYSGIGSGAVQALNVAGARLLTERRGSSNGPVNAMFSNVFTLTY